MKPLANGLLFLTGVAGIYVALLFSLHKALDV